MAVTARPPNQSQYAHGMMCCCSFLRHNSQQAGGRPANGNGRQWLEGGNPTAARVNRARHWRTFSRPGTSLMRSRRSTGILRRDRWGADAAPLTVDRHVKDRRGHRSQQPNSSLHGGCVFAGRSVVRMSGLMSSRRAGSWRPSRPVSTVSDFRNRSDQRGLRQDAQDAEDHLYAY